MRNEIELKVLNEISKAELEEAFGAHFGRFERVGNSGPHLSIEFERASMIEEVYMKRFGGIELWPQPERRRGTRVAYTRR